MKILILLVSLFSCQKPKNQPLDNEVGTLQDRQKRYCEQSEKLYYERGLTTDPYCDAALFTALHGLVCDYVTVTQFESPWEPGKLCRRPNCSCFDNWVEGTPGSDSEFSKDMATGIQLYLATRPDKELAKRVLKYGGANGWIVCDAANDALRYSKCLMSPKIAARWYDLAGRRRQLTVAFEDHLSAISILVGYKLEGAISNSALDWIKKAAKREPNNLLFQAMASRFTGKPSSVKVATRLLEFFPEDLPTNKNWSAHYLWERDEIINGRTNPDWLPGKKKQTHAGTDFLVASWVLSL